MSPILCANCQNRRVAVADMDLEAFDMKMMREALSMAKRAAASGEVPVGAILTVDGQIIARAHNQVEQLCDATAHAEMICITTAASDMGQWRLTGSTLYCTLEPCAMCLGALIASRVERLVFGAPDIRQGACGSWVDLIAARHPIHQLQVHGGVLVQESAELLRAFFRARRESNNGCQP